MISPADLTSFAAALGKPNTQDGKILALRQISVPRNLILPWVRDPSRITPSWEARIQETLSALPSAFTVTFGIPTITTEDTDFVASGEITFDTDNGTFVSGELVTPHGVYASTETVGVSVSTPGVFGYQLRFPVGDLVSGDEAFVRVTMSLNGVETTGWSDPVELTINDPA